MKQEHHKNVTETQGISRLVDRRRGRAKLTPKEMTLLRGNFPYYRPKYVERCDFELLGKGAKVVS